LDKNPFTMKTWGNNRARFSIENNKNNEKNANNTKKKSKNNANNTKNLI
jgi:hypothetical protein